MDLNFPTHSFCKVEARLKQSYKEIKFKQRFLNRKLPYTLSHKQIHNQWANFSCKIDSCWFGTSQFDLADLGFSLFARYWNQSLLTLLKVQACLFVNSYSITPA